MSTHQVSKPSAAKKSIAEESARPGTCRSKVGCEAMDEPCTNKILPEGPEGSPPCLFHRNKRTSLPFFVQCSSPGMTVAGETGLFIVDSSSAPPASLPTPAISVCGIGGPHRPQAKTETKPALFRLYVIGFDDFCPLV